MRVACVGGGPGGLFAAALIKRRRPDADVTVFERNRSDDTYGFGVVFSDATLEKIDSADAVLSDALKSEGQYWTSVEVRMKGETFRIGGNGMAAISRQRLLSIMQELAVSSGVVMKYETAFEYPAQAADFDLVVASDGANSHIRAALSSDFEPSEIVSPAKFIWLGTTYRFRGLTFMHKASPHGVFAVHGYPISEELGTFIVETDEESWRRAGLDQFDDDQAPGVSDEKSRSYLQDLFQDEIDGHELLANNSRWSNFRTRRAATWSVGNVALLGDSAHTAHFSVGSGTKMAMEDAIDLANALAQTDDLPTALAAYEVSARPSVQRIQEAARPSLSWWENFGRYFDAFEPWQFTYHFMTRSISNARLERRDSAFVDFVERTWNERNDGSSLDTPVYIGSTPFVSGHCFLQDGLVPRLVSDSAGGPWIPMGSRPDESSDSPWGLLVTAPDREDLVLPTVARAMETASRAPGIVAVTGGTSLTRVLVSEELRFGGRGPVAVVEQSWDPDRARTLLLSGRADLVVVRRPDSEADGA